MTASSSKNCCSIQLKSPSVGNVSPRSVVGSLLGHIPQPGTVLQHFLGTGFTPAPRCQGLCIGVCLPRLSRGDQRWVLCREQQVNLHQGFSGSTMEEQGQTSSQEHCSTLYSLQQRLTHSALTPSRTCLFAIALVYCLPSQQLCHTDTRCPATNVCSAMSACVQSLIVNTLR